jgi:hypothetical protein
MNMNKTFTKERQWTKVFKYGLIVFATATFPMPQSLFATDNVLFTKGFFQETITVKGTVVDDKDGQPIPGATITDNQRKVLGTTNGNGEYSIRVSVGTEISFYMIGYSTVKQTAAVGQGNLVIRFKESSNDLNEVMVTALGIKREEKSLGYAVTTINRSCFK